MSDWNRWRIGHAVRRFWRGERGWYWRARRDWKIRAVARKLRCSVGMVGKWRARFLKGRLEALYDEPRPGTPRTVSDAQVEQVVIQTLESTPRGETHWSTRGLAKATGLSRMTISRIWHAFGLQPHRTDTFKLSPDPQLIDKVRDIVGLVYEPSGTRPGVVRRRKEPDSGARPHAAAAAYAAGSSWSEARTITNATEPPRCLPRWS